MSMTYSYVYKLTNKINNKCYIGKSNNPEKRLARHCSIAKTGYNKNYKFQLIHKAIRKYGKENFIFEIIEKCDKSIVFQREVYWIDYYKSNNIDFGYNISEGGNGGSTPSEETREKISKTLSGRTNSLNGLFKKLYKIFCLIPEYKKDIYKSAKKERSEKIREETISDILSNFGNVQKGVLNDSVKKDILKLKSLGPLYIRDLAEIFQLEEKTIKYIISRYGKNGVPTEEQKRENRSKARRGKKLSKKHREAISKGNKGKTISKEVKDKISEANSGSKNGMSGKSHSAASRAKMSEFQKNRKRRKLTQKEKGKISSKLKGRPRPKPLSKYLKAKIRSLYATGDFTKKQIAEKLGIKYNTVVGVLRKAGRPTSLLPIS